MPFFLFLNFFSYGYGGGAGVLYQTDQPQSQKSSNTGQDSETSSQKPKNYTTSTTEKPPTTTVPKKYGSSSGSEKCVKCDKPVYFAEQALGPGNQKYHKTCFKCNDCNKTVDSTTMADKGNVLYCRPCHGRKFGPKGYGFGAGASFLNTERAG